MPTPPTKNYYELLGVPRTATTDEIKKRYRELARKLHPDVNPDKAGAARLFADVTTAYKTLTDADSRAVYDYDQSRIEEQRARANARATSTYTPPPTSPFNAPPRGASGGAAESTSGGRSSANTSGADVSRLVAEAQAAFVRNKLVEARSLAQEALRLNRRNAQAYEVLGDVYRLQGKTEEAMNMYTMALQINPRNSTVMQRLERMSRAAQSANRYDTGGGASADRVFFSNRDTPPTPGSRPFQGAGGSGGARTPGRPASYGRPAASDPRDKSPIGLLLTGVFGYGGVFLLLLWATLFLSDNSGKLKPFAPDLAPISSWNGPLLFVMALSGVLLGATMAITGAIRRIDDELLLPGSGVASGLRGGAAPLGLLLLVVSVVSFYAAALLYVIVAALQEIAMKSMLRVFAAVITITLLLAAVYDPGHVQVLLFGGNVIFLTFAFGWFLGDFFRPDVF